MSSTWRHAVYATPQLWTSVALNSDNDELLELHVTGSRFLHLSLELHVPLLRSKTHPFKGDRPLERIAHKLKSLILVGVTDDDALSHLSTLEFPFLERIGVVRRDYFPLKNLKVACAPVLRHLSLQMRPHRNGLHLELPWSSITSLYFCGVTISICSQALEQCKNLVNFYCRDARVAGNFIEPPQTPLTLSHLKSFSLSSYNLTGVSVQVRKLRMPSLQSFELGYESPITEAWEYLFRELPSTLQSLRFCAFQRITNVHIPYPECWIKHVPSVRELGLDHCSKSFVDNTFAALSLFDRSTGEPVHLPMLRTLVVTIFIPPLDEGVILDGAREMVKKRFAGQMELPTFSISSVVGDVVPEVLCNMKDQRMVFLEYSIFIS